MESSKHGMKMRKQTKRKRIEKSQRVAKSKRAVKKRQPITSPLPPKKAYKQTVEDLPTRPESPLPTKKACIQTVEDLPTDNIARPPYAMLLGLGVPSSSPSDDDPAIDISEESSEKIEQGIELMYC